MFYEAGSDGTVSALGRSFPPPPGERQNMKQVHEFPLPMGNLSIRQAEQESPQRDLPLWAFLFL